MHVCSQILGVVAMCLKVIPSASPSKVAYMTRRRGGNAPLCLHKGFKQGRPFYCDCSQQQGGPMRTRVRDFSCLMSGFFVFKFTRFCLTLCAFSSSFQTLTKEKFQSSFISSIAVVPQMFVWRTIVDKSGHYYNILFIQLNCESVGQSAFVLPPFKVAQCGHFKHLSLLTVSIVCL